MQSKFSSYQRWSLAVVLGAVLGVVAAQMPAQAACTNPATIPQGFTAPCPVFSLSATAITQAQTLTLSATPQAGTDYIYTTAYVSQGTTWNPYTLQGNNAYPAYSSAVASLTLPATQLQALSLGTHYAVVWDWLWDATANCYKGPGLNQCNTGAWRVQSFSLTSAATPTPTPTPPPYVYSQSSYYAYSQASYYAYSQSAYTTSCTTNVWSNLETCGWPGPSNTGPDLSQCPGGVLTTNSGATTRTITISTAGTVINCQNITGGLQIAAQNVTIKNSIIAYDGGGAGGSGVININDGASASIDHVELNGLNHTHACIWDEGIKGSALTYSMVAKNVNCHNINDGIFSWWWSSDKNAGAGSDFLIQDSYFHDFTENAANGHIDGYQTEGAQNGTITHNTYLMRRAANDVTVSGGGLNSAISIWDGYNQSTPTGLTAGNITISNNLLSGGGFTSYAEDYSGPNGQATENVANSAVGGNSLVNVKYFNNKFSTYLNSCVGQYGTWFYRGAWPPYYGGPTDLWNQGGSVRSGNTVLETGENIDTGGPSGCEGYNTSPPSSTYTYSQSSYTSGPVVSVSPATIVFPSQTVGTTSAVQYATLTNTGNATLNFISDAITGDFAFGGLGSCVNPGGTLAPGASCKYSAKFTPTAVGTRTGTITIVDNASNSPQIINLTGTGTTTYTYSQSSYYAYSQSTYYAYSKSAYTYTYSQSAYTSSCTNNCYYIAANGSDANSGTSKISPWLHAPGMASCANNCAAKVPQPGDSFIFRGGDTWHFGNSALSPFAGQSWRVSSNGSATNCNVDASKGALTTSTCIYFGVDQTWFAGSSWSRPIMNLDNPLSTGSPASCAYNDTANVVWLNGSYVIVDNFEFQGYCWNTTNPWAGVLHLGNNFELKNSYFHGWTMGAAATGCTSCDDDSYMSVMAGNGRIDHNVFDGSDSTYGDLPGKATGQVFAVGTVELDHNVLNRVSNGIKFNSVNLVHDNYFFNMFEPVVAGTHGNVIEWSGPPANSSTYYFNNLVGLTNEGETIDMYPGAASGGKFGYIFNNVMTGPNGNPGNCYMIEGDNSGGPGRTYFFNNTSDSPCGMRGLRYTTPPPATYQNNHFIGYSSSALSAFEYGFTVTDNGSEIFQSESTANGQGYTRNNNYAPTGSSGATVGVGANLSSFCASMDNSIGVAACKKGYGGVMYDVAHHVAVDNAVTTRPASGAWDAGAYQF